MAGKVEPLSPLQAKAVDAAVKDALKQEMSAGRTLSGEAVQEFIAERTKAITGTDTPGMYKSDHAKTVNDTTTRFIEEAVQKHDKNRAPYGGQIIQLPTVPLQRTEEKGRLL